MDKLQFGLVTGELNQDTYQALVDDLKNDSFVQKYFLKKNIPSSVLSHHAYQVDRWRKARKKIDEKTFVGYMDGLEYDGILQDVLEPSQLQLQMMKEQEHLKNYLVNDLPKSFYTVRFDKIDLTTDSYAQVVSKAMNACFDHSGIYLYGRMGSGKSYLAVCACNFFADRNETVAYIHYPSFCERVLSRLRTGEYREEVNRLGYAKFLVIDDIGAEEVTEKNNSILLSILDIRMQNGLMTWFTSNEDFNTLQDRLAITNRLDGRNQAMRILERIRAISIPLKVVENDRRTLSSIK